MRYAAWVGFAADDLADLGSELRVTRSSASSARIQRLLPTAIPALRCAAIVCPGNDRGRGAGGLSTGHRFVG